MATSRERIYREASNILEMIEDKKGSLKSLVFTMKMTTRRKKAIYAMVANTIKNKDIINQVIKESQILSLQPKLSQSLSMVLLNDMLYKRGGDYTIRGPLTRSIRHYQSILMDVFDRLVKCNDDIKGSNRLPSLPCYLRINTLIDHVTLHDVMDELIHSTRIETCTIDPLIPHLLVLPSNVSITSSQIYKDHKVIIQDKSSCMPAYVLSPPPGSVIMDTCAAPGNKTSHLASIMNNTGNIYALDKDKMRYKAMKKYMRDLNVTCVKCYNKDFLKVDPLMYVDVEYILVDPSCSGSGIVKRLELHNEVDEKRLVSLSKFQVMMLKHALSFPSVIRVVYSTCSIHKEENEDVVHEALMEYSDTFKLVHILPEWEARGLSHYPQGASCVRVIPHIHNCQGFFIAMFERIKSS